MKISKRNLLGLMLAFAVILCSGLGFSQEKLSTDRILSYFASLYVPYDATRNAGFSMTFGRELVVPAGVNPENQKIPQRTFLK